MIQGTSGADAVLARFPRHTRNEPMLVEAFARSKTPLVPMVWQIGAPSSTSMIVDCLRYLGAHRLMPCADGGTKAPLVPTRCHHFFMVFKPFFFGHIYIYEFSTENFFSSRHWILQGFESREKVNFNKGQLVWMDHSSIVIFFLIKIEILLKFVWMNHDGSSIVFLFLICVRIHIRILLLWEHIHELWICGA